MDADTQTSAKVPPFPKFPLFVAAGAALLFLFLRTGLHSVDHTGWIDSREQAITEARQANKLVLMDFTGSDWCEGCIRLDREVFSTPEFKDYAAKKLVLMEVDFPRRKYLPPETQRQNAKLQEEYGIEGFPTVIVLNAAGKQVGRFNYTDGGAKAFIAALETLPKA